MEPHNPVKNAAQDLNDFNLIAKLSKRDMEMSDAKYHLICLTSLYPQENKIDCTYCDNPVNKQITLVFSFLNTTSTKFKVPNLTNPASELIIATSHFQMFSAKVLINNVSAQLL